MQERTPICAEVKRNRLYIRGVPIDTATRQSTLACCRSWLDSQIGSFHHMVTVNPEFVVAAQSNSQFRTVLQDAALATADGIGITLASYVLGQPVPERVTGVELVEGLAAIITTKDPVFFLGAAPGVAETAANRLQEQNPDLRIAGTWSGSPDAEDASEILSRIRSSRARILLVAFGAPAQDLWIAKYQDTLAEYGIVVAVGVGGTFDYLAGTVPRAPSVIRKIGLEWLYRLIRQPWRWRRQLALPVFVWYVAQDYIVRRRILK